MQGARVSTFELLARDDEPARVLRVELDDIVNPRSKNLILVVTALLPSARIEVGRLSFYPANQGGIFVLRLPSAVAAHVDEHRSVTIRCALEAEPDGDLDAEQVRVRAIALKPEPR